MLPTYVLDGNIGSAMSKRKHLSLTICINVIIKTVDSIRITHT